MSNIDYAAQFKTITVAIADEMTRGWKRHRVYTDAKQAFTSAQRTEARGIDVAFATTGFGQYHVWAEQREALVGTYHGIAKITCRDCGYATVDPFTMEAINDMTEVCPACESDHLTFTSTDGTSEDFGDDVSYCERCNLGKAHTSNAIAGDLNSAYWCDDCKAEVNGAVPVVHGHVDCAVADDPKRIALALLMQYDALVADLAALEADEARDKYIAERQQSIDEMAPSLAEALRHFV